MISDILNQVMLVMKGGLLVVPVSLIIGGALFVIPTAAFVLYKLFSRLGCKAVQGKCVRIEKKNDKEIDSTSIHPVIEFMTYRGEKFEVKTGIGHGLKYLPAVNDPVKVYYRPENPQRAHVVNKGMWEVSGILVFTGFSLILIGLLMGSGVILA